jgi:leucine dehydrogenase
MVISGCAHKTKGVPMDYFSRISDYGHEQVVFCHDKAVNLKAIIAIHSTILGPALGGCRMWPYNSETEALEDVLRLSRGMTFKNAAAGLNIGGGKAVIIGDPNQDKSEALFRSFGQFVQSLNGRYITAEDVGTSVEDMQYIRMQTKHVAGLPKSAGGSGDPSPATARGVFEGIKAGVKHLLKDDNLEGLTVAVQGTGNVGLRLCELLSKAGARLIITDIFRAKAERVAETFKARTVSPDEIYGVDADIFSPCALGAILNADTIPRMRFKIIAGSANNQLKDEERDTAVLRQRGILYAPDFIINAGGVINVYYEVTNSYNEAAVDLKVRKIGDTLTRIFDIAQNQGIATTVAANVLAEKRIQEISGIHRKFIPV